MLSIAEPLLIQQPQQWFCSYSNHGTQIHLLFGPGFVLLRSTTVSLWPTRSLHVHRVPIYSHFPSVVWRCFPNVAHTTPLPYHSPTRSLPVHGVHVDGGRGAVGQDASAHLDRAMTTWNTIVYGNRFPFYIGGSAYSLSISHGTALIPTDDDAESHRVQYRMKHLIIANLLESYRSS